MTLKKRIMSVVPYFTLLFFLAAISTGARLIFTTPPDSGEGHDFQLFMIGSMLFIGYYINRIAPKTVIPSFVWAMFAGMAIQPLLSFFTEDISSLKVIMEVFGAIILFAGGLEIPFRSFQKWFVPIAVLSVVGILMSAIGFAGVVFGFLHLSNTFSPLLIPSILIVAAALSSTDPTAIIPTLRDMRFRKPELKQIAIAESALTDVSGSIFTRFLLLALITVPVTGGSVLPYFVPLLQKSTYDAFALEIISGILVGYVGFFLLKRFYYAQKDKEEVDPALVIAVPIFTYVLGNILAGAGFLAAFISGLLTDLVGGIKKVSHFYDSLLNHLIKPFIFIILGALVPMETLLALAPIGIVSAIIFMFILRPLVVFITLAPWLFSGVFGVRDLLFLSLIRETGIIAAILIVIAATFEVIQSEFVIAIGMWVILFTLIIEPPLTPVLARKIGVTTDK